MTGRRSHGRLSALNGVVHQGRFHPEPGGLLDVTTQFDVDPSHITLLNKDCLRVLFVLEGFRQRDDLESTIDWLGKGRVLVYEKPETPV